MAPSPLAPPRPSAAISGRPQVVQGFFAGNRPRAVIQPHRPGAVQPRVLGSAMQLPPGTLTLRPHGTGQRLPEAVQRKMSDLFKADFSDVRVHVGNEAASIGALAFTHGSDLYFAPGQYNPHAPHGQRLIAHELTHVIQQRAGRVRNPFGAGVAVVQDPGLEAEAERMGRRVATSVVAVQPLVAVGQRTRAVRRALWQGTPTAPLSRAVQPTTNPWAKPKPKPKPPKNTYAEKPDPQQIKVLEEKEKEEKKKALREGKIARLLRYILNSANSANKASDQFNRYNAYPENRYPEDLILEAGEQWETTYGPNNGLQEAHFLSDHLKEKNGYGNFLWQPPGQIGYRYNIHIYKK